MNKEKNKQESTVNPLVIKNAGNKLLTLSEILKTGEIDLNLYRNNKAYNGKTAKFGVTIEKQNYIVKRKKTSFDDTSVFSEHVASSFIRMSGISAQETYLLTDKVTKEPVVLIKDFTKEGEYLRSYESTRESSEDTDITTKAYTYKDILYMIEKHTKIYPGTKPQVVLQFWQMYCMDAILANRDRHMGNWGYLATETKGYRAAPVYDNGASLFPQVLRHFDEYIKGDSKAFILERSSEFPASKLMEYDSAEHRNKKTNYFRYIQNNLNNSDSFFDGLRFTIQKLRSMGILRIAEITRSCVTDSRIPLDLQHFYFEIICVRYLHIVHGISPEEAYAQLPSFI